MNTRTCCRLLGFTLLLAPALGWGATVAKRPNLLFIIVDDQSPFDLKAYNLKSALQTPVIDRLAAQGMTLDGAYHMGSFIGGVCTPSRHMVMSGRTLWHLPASLTSRLFQNYRNDLCPPNLEQNTIPAVFNRAGYATMRTCKIGNSYEAANALFTVRKDASKNGDTDETGSAWHAERVLDYLGEREKSRSTQPFLIYFGFTHPHDPRNGKPELLDKYGAVNHRDRTALPPQHPKTPQLPVNYLPQHPFFHGHPELRDEVAVDHLAALRVHRPRVRGAALKDFQYRGQVETGAPGERQPFRETVLGSNAAAPLKAGTEVFRNEDVRVWSLDGQVLIASITAKLHLISPGVIEGLLKAVELAEEAYQGLVIWSPDDVFSAGANLEALMPVFMKSGGKGILPVVKLLQDTMLRVRYAQVPVVAAMRGIALGGGCEIAIHSAKRVAAMETYMGFVEVGVGLLPAGGGLTYLARRAAEMANAASANADILKFLTDGFTSAATAKVGTSAIESRKMGYLLWSDVIVPNKDELLHVASQQVKAMAESGWRAPAKAPFPVAGRNAIATIKAQLVNLRDGGFASAHDFHIATQIAEVVCGGDVDAGSLVTEEYLMTMERVRFCALLDHPKTQERIMGMLQTGKPVRN